VLAQETGGELDGVCVCSSCREGRLRMNNTINEKNNRICSTTQVSTKNYGNTNSFNWPFLELLHILLFLLLINNDTNKLPSSVSTLLVGWQEGHPACKKYRGMAEVGTG